VGVFFNKDIYCEMKELIRHIIREHIMEQKRAPYTKEELEKEALKYNSMSEFSKGSPSMYVSAKNKGDEFYRKITSHFKRKVREPYTFDEIKTIASKYNHPGEFQKGNNSAYIVARNKGWFDEVTKHMSKLSTDWDKDKIKELVKKYETQKEFTDNHPNAYMWILRNMSQIDREELFSDMRKLGNLHHRMIYAYEFPDKSVYVGLTYDPKKRSSQHLTQVNSAVKKYIDETGITPELKFITDFVGQEESVIKERETEEEYRKNGWKILNVKKTGALGSIVIKWNFNNVKNEALKYNSRKDFAQGSPGAYGAAKKYGWFDEITKHMNKSKTAKRSYDEIKKVASQYNSPSEFKLNDYGAFLAARKYGWYDDVTSHMKRYGSRSSK
jgi:predicted GIY-YIG superfamily endonuclease